MPALPPSAACRHHNANLGRAARRTPDTIERPECLIGAGLRRLWLSADQPAGTDRERGDGDDAEDRDPGSARHRGEACQLVGVRAPGPAPPPLAVQFDDWSHAPEKQE